MSNQKIYQYLMAFGHFCSDINQTALTALLPFLIAIHHYDYTTAAMLVLVANMVSSVVQPLFGHLADKFNWVWIVPVGLLLAGGGIAATGYTSDFWQLCLAVMISGIGIAMFHPQAAKLVNLASGLHNRGTALSIFAFGGSTGAAMGPILITASIALFGVQGTLTFLLIELLACLMIGRYYRALTELNGGSIKAKQANAQATQQDQWGAFSVLCVVMFGRSIIYYGLNTFLALYWINVLGTTETVGNTMLSIYYTIGAICTLFGGKLADKFGARNVLKCGFAVLFPSIALLAMTGNELFASALLLPMGAAIHIVYSPTVVLGQQYLPNRIGFASGITLGLAISIGGITAPILGKIADIYGLTTALYSVALVPLVGAFLLAKPKD
ncbi:MFS transporter [Caviibacterium pharyngocola]|uniref:MFS transporter n=1 Tax=Caviibacterium pharyngocola TaxID=28159 RepID=A0A2M8RUC6_9PAST|nr:MFS transporter [Caviibacterium pharyngocola]PJG82490.1 MFS transporter [Caviibacterium pharyngocola]